ncbi:hypothetical protein F4778DRAFT_326249 [Xylariomycetidae sp. FL2044]|nr:hypothetical protein F4778DRAFT_326249 [Xylariomycetidae sp. FL2044]
MPERWWSDHHRNSNGFFGCEEAGDEDYDAALNTWAFFETKHLYDSTRYEWLKINIFTQWVASRKQSVVVLFDITTPVAHRLIKSLKDIEISQVVDPFWAYVKVADELTRLQDGAIWAVRDQVRAIETGKWFLPNSEPDFRRLHDLGRHAIHVTETLDVSVKTLAAVLAQHQETQPRVPNSRLWRNHHVRLLSCKQLLESLRCRSNSNQERLLNEIQLAFNLVAQETSKGSMRIGEAAQADSAAMKTISIVTLTFLPPTFICAIFSMSFFNYDTDSGWTLSDQFWVYWAFAIPVTVTVLAVYQFW